MVANIHFEHKIFEQNLRFIVLWICVDLKVSFESQVKKRVKQSRNGPGVAQCVPGGLGSQISMTFGTWRSASRTGRLYHQEMFLVLIFTRGWVDPRAMVRLEGSMSLKNPVTPPGIDPGTVRLVVQCLNHYATPGPIWVTGTTPHHHHHHQNAWKKCKQPWTRTVFSF